MILLSSKQRALACIYTSVLIDQLGGALTLPVMPYYVESLGGSATVVGALFSTFAIGQIVSSMWMGIASDRYGRRPIILISLAGSCIGMLGSALAPTYQVLFAARLFLGLFSGSMSAANAYITDICPPADVPKRMAMLNALAGLSFVVGPPVGSALAALEMKAPFYAGATTSFLAFSVALQYMRTPAQLAADDAAALAPTRLERRQKTASALAAAHGDGAGPGVFTASKLLVWRRRAGRGAPDRRGVSNRGMLGAMFCARVCAAVAQQTIWTILALYVEAALGWSASQFGLVLMGAAVIYAYTQLALFNKLQQRYGLAPLGAAASLLLATGQLMFAGLEASTMPYVLFAAATLCGVIGMTLCDATYMPAMAHASAHQHVGFAVSLGAMASSGGRVGAPMLFGFLFEHVSHTVPFLLAAAAAVCGGGFYALYHALDLRERGAALGSFAPLRFFSSARAARDTEASNTQQAVADAIDELQTELREILVSRKYQLEKRATVLTICALLDKALPVGEEGEDEEALLEGHYSYLNEKSYAGADTAAML